MDVVKIKIGNKEYDVKDAVVRSWMSGNGASDFKRQVQNLIKYGVADISGLSSAQLAEMAANMMQYGTPDVSGYTESQLQQMMENLAKYGIANTAGLTSEQLAALEEAHNTAIGKEVDPVFADSAAAKFVGSVNESTGVLTLVGE